MSKILFALALATIILSSRGVPGAIDPTFDPGAGLDVSKPIPVRVIFPLGDGSFLLGGIFTNYGGIERHCLARIFENGAIDINFVPDASFETPNSEVWSISQQPDGKLIVGGVSGANIRGMMVRLNLDGSVDSTFNFPVRQSVFVMAVQARGDGLIEYLSDDNFGIGLVSPDGARLMTSGGLNKPFGLFDRIRISAEGDAFYSHNGGLFRFAGAFGAAGDNAFPGGGGLTYDFDFQSDGRIVCIGTGNSSAGLRRYMANGALDTTFKPTVAGKDVDALVAQADDKILIGGTFTSVNGAARRNLARLNANGTTDTNFVTGAGPNGSVYAIAPVGSGKALIAGSFTSYDGLSRTGIARIFLDDPAPPAIVVQPSPASFLEGQMLRLSIAVSATPPIAYQWKKDGVAIEGATNQVFFAKHARRDQAGVYAVKITSGQGSVSSADAPITVAAAPTGVGALDPSFASGGGATRTINAYLKLGDGSSLVGGDFYGYDGRLRPALARLRADGSLDETFDLGLPTGANCKTLALTDDGSVVAGFTSTLNYPSRATLMRFAPDGNLLGTYFTNILSDILAVAPTTDGSIYIGGAFTTLDGVTRPRLAKLNFDFSVDQTFDSNPLVLTKVYALAIQSDGKIIVGDEKRLLRLFPNGAVDVDLTLIASSGQGVRCLSLQADGKILVGGRFTGIGGVARTNLARLNSDMTIDATFTAAAGVSSISSSAVTSIALQGDGKILIGGTFNDAAGSSRTNFARFLGNGELDTGFAPAVGFDAPLARATVNTIAVASDVTAIVGGLFGNVNGFERNSLAQIFTSTAPLKLAASVAVADGKITLRFPDSGTSDSVLQYVDVLPGSWQDLGAAPFATNFVDQPITGSQRYFRLKQASH